MRKNIYLIHISEKDCLKTKLLKPVPLGLENSLILIQDDNDENNIMQTLDLLCVIELINWIPINRITEIIACFKERLYHNKQLIIE